MPRRPPSLWTDRPDDWPAARPGTHRGSADPDGARPGDEEPTAEARVAPRPQPAVAAPRSAPSAPRPARAMTAAGRAATPSRRTMLWVAAAAAVAGISGAITVLAVDGSGGSASRASGSGSAATTLPASGGTVAPTPTARLYRQASRAVVSIRVRTASGEASGTGFLIDRDGTVVTNSHVVESASSVQVVVDDSRAPVRGRVKGTDPSSDLAVVKLDAVDVAGITPLRLAESKDVRVGDSALAIGYPLGLDRTATSGIVSGVGREIEAPNGFNIDEVIQTDAPINPGNSGGPLLDAAGRVIGVNSQIATAGGGGGSVGIGFAVPSDTVREVVPRLLAGETIRRPYLGVSTGDTATPGDGATVATVVAGGPADKAGLQAGDTILRVGDSPILRSQEVATAIADRSPGDRIPVEIRRDGGVQTVTVTLGTRPESTP